MSGNRRLKSTLFFASSFFVLLEGYAFNAYNATDYRKMYDNAYYSIMQVQQQWDNFLDNPLYQTFDRFSESLVIGRILKSEKDGSLSAGAFPGRVGSEIFSPKPPDVDSLMLLHISQYILYLNDSTIPENTTFYPYRSQSGGQAQVFAILNKIIPGKNGHKLIFFYFMTAALAALAFSLIVFWFFREFGWYTACVLTVCFSLLCYPTLYAKNLWWMLWAFYVPFIVFLYLLRKEEQFRRNLRLKEVFAVSLLCMIIKIYFNGFEFMTTVILMTILPFVYYAVKNKWNYKVLLRRTGVALWGIGTSMCLAFAVLCLQFVLAGARFSDGLLQIYSKFMERSFWGGSSGINYALATNSPDAGGLSSVVKYYITQPLVFDLRVFNVEVVVRMIHIFALICIFVLLELFIGAVLKKRESDSRAKALSVVLVLSMVPALSWFIVFEEHSCDHIVHDPIVWYMPFMFFAAAYVSVFSNSLFCLISRRPRQKAAN